MEESGFCPKYNSETGPFWDGQWHEVCFLKVTLAVVLQMSWRRTIYCVYPDGSRLGLGGRQERQNERDWLRMCFPRLNTTSGWLCELMKCRKSREGLEYKIKSPVLVYSLWDFHEVVKQTCQVGSAHFIWSRRSHTFRWATPAHFSSLSPGWGIWASYPPCWSILACCWSCLQFVPVKFTQAAVTGAPAPSQTALYQFLRLDKWYLQWFPLPV